ncbi:8-oxo-dGTP diphosphatase [Marchantia polymorpha subsp. ruderalis]|uniref:Oxidized purine nucleoside triphosphate hydrolase n=1 Tax=Marchantia polymorpha TaxID=3197 RepID=A0A2R6WCJ9_MARPO|nr:hypothetical protein MARPO_0109s0009 [Marchantia polymorpha]BBN02616.1 hypothetical protein Mp_2g16680 [Marchantia polymorpha subsp. ruderalis]PTQ31575.1 hypothetical protein MARPO_0109s0009 [Marchantia polymorpha]PTQ31576.1 hypothetical protein MARPO_0109s0009 [Marchantia polymorpha]BBN02617.1 hypothetical protein Mp_2g16680 [Marchantia polymorpha subsp. ruderalis]|eukprot:PTQ31574.1 hypothetical protein MARPO_0109s0009 [Marchantia polymorpha]
MVLLSRLVLRKLPKVSRYIAWDLELKTVVALSWAPSSNLSTRNSSCALPHIIGGSPRVRELSGAGLRKYSSAAMSMAVDDREAVKQSITSTVVEEPVQKESTARKLLTLVIIHSDGKVLLGLKKRGFGKGYYNGFGGKVEKGETIDQAAARELQEESGVTATDMEKRGILTFHFDNDPLAWEVHVYYATKFLGEPCETDEMAPTWFSVADIPYDVMWSDDPLWYPLLLAGQQFKGDFCFTNTTTLTSHTIEVVSSL